MRNIPNQNQVYDLQAQITDSQQRFNIVGFGLQLIQSDTFIHP